VNPAVQSISAFFPCYNDEATIASMVNLAFTTIDEVGADGEVIVINDGSTDRSPQVLADLQAKEPRLRVVTHPTNRGYGGALLSGFAAAKEQWVFYTDGDAQFDPSELAQLVAAAADDVDVVQGYKIRRADILARRVIGRVYHRFVAFMFGLHIRDTDCDFRLIRHSALDRVHLVHTTGVICVELVRKLQDSGARFVEVPVHHYARAHGHSEFFRVSSVARSLRDLAFLWLRLVAFGRRSSSPGAGSSGAGSTRTGREDDHGAAERDPATP
jgi:glycosyltransferase involved in cell wall biosynthesis